MKKYSLYFGVLAVLITMSGAAQAAGNIASVSVIPANPTFGQTVKFKVTTSNQNECWASVGVQNARFGLIVYDAHISNAADSGETFTTTLSNGGTYTIVAEASSEKNPKCKGTANFTFEVKRPKLNIPAGPTVCPDPSKDGFTAFTVMPEGVKVSLMNSFTLFQARHMNPYKLDPDRTLTVSGKTKILSQSDIKSLMTPEEYVKYRTAVKAEL